MKLAGGRAAAFCGRPDPRMKGALLHGPDGGLLALRRREIVTALTGGDDLRLTRLEAAVAQKDTSEIDAAVRAIGFFPGRRVVLIEGAKDGLAAALGPVLEEAGPEDAFVVVTAEGLAARSALRKLFEGSGDLASLGLYPDAPDGAEIAAMLEAAGLACGLAPDAARLLEGAAAGIDRGSLAQLVEKIAVYGIGRTPAIPADELEVLLPAAEDSELDRLVGAVAEGRAGAVGPMIARLTASGSGPVPMLIAAQRHFRQLLALVSAGDGIDAALNRLRPPAFGPRRNALAAQARRWGPGRLEAANRILFQTDRSLRAAGDRPDRALVERCLIRLAMMAGR